VKYILLLDYTWK